MHQVEGRWWIRFVTVTLTHGPEGLIRRGLPRRLNLSRLAKQAKKHTTCLKRTLTLNILHLKPLLSKTTILSALLRARIIYLGCRVDKNTHTHRIMRTCTRACTCTRTHKTHTHTRTHTYLPTHLQSLTQPLTVATHTHLITNTHN